MYVFVHMVCLSVLYYSFSDVCLYNINIIVERVDCQYFSIER
jgi:hypothetical protein